MKVIVNGAKGRMGQETVKAIQSADDLECVAECQRGDDLSLVINMTSADIVIDFTTPDVVYENTLTIIKHGVHPIIGATGLTQDQIAECQQRAAEKQLGGIIAPNFSLGAILMMQFSKQASRYFNDVEIIEMHHPKKLDAPSGTAIKTAALIAEHRRASAPASIDPSRGDQSHQVPIHSLRLPGFVASQQVVFGGESESLTVQHHTLDRSCFMPGVLLACRQVSNLKTLLYGLESLLEIDAP